MRKKVSHVMRSTVLELTQHNIRNRFGVLLDKRGIKQRHSFCLCLTAVRREFALPYGGIDPSGCHRYKLFVEPRRTRTIQSQPPNEQDSGNRVRSLRHTRSRQIVMNKALSGEARQQSLDDALLKMHL